LACERGFQSVVNILLDKDADVCSQDFNRNTPLHLAIRNGNVSVIERLLLQQSQVVNKQNQVKYQQPIFECMTLILL